MFFGVFIPIATNPPFNPILPLMFAVGASSVIIFFSIALSLNPIKGKNFLEKIEQKEKTTKLLVALIFIAVGILYLIK
jgi:threonine/homoserine/homoserine lactone efflux protein